MKIVFNLAWSNLKTNKNKSVLIIITIILTTILTTFVGIMGVKSYKQNLDNIISSYGNNHGWIQNLNMQQVEELKEYGDVGTVAFVGSSNINKNELSIYYKDYLLQDLDLVDLHLKKGRMPIKDNEIMIDEDYLRILDNTPALGKKIEMNCIIDGTEHKKSFVVVGITEGNESYHNMNMYFTVVSKEFMLQSFQSEENISLTAYIRFKGNLSKNSITIKLKDLVEKLGIDKKYLRVNDYLINATKPYFSNIFLVFSIILIICISSMLIIYNIFYISIMNDMKTYGQLIAIGADKKQVKRMVLYQGNILSLISIPIGIIVSYGFSFIVDELLMKKTVNISEYMLQIVLLSVLINYITVIISILKPMKLASRISPIDAIRLISNKDNKKEKSGYKYITVSRLVVANLKKHKKRTIITLLSLILSSFLIIIVSTIVDSSDLDKIAYEQIGGDFCIALSNYTFGGTNIDKELNTLQVNNPLSNQFIESIKSLQGVNEVRIMKRIKVKIDGHENEVFSLRGKPNSQLKEIKQKDIIKGKVDTNSINRDNGIIISSLIANDFGMKIGDKVNFIIFDGYREIKKMFIVQAIADVGELLTSSENIDRICDTNTRNYIYIDVDSSKYDIIDEKISSITRDNNNLRIMKRINQLEILKRKQYNSSVMLYSLVAIIGMISFLNFINTIITSIFSRKKEFGILQAVGLSNNQFKTYAIIESSFYLVSTVVITMTLGNYIAYKICGIINKIIGGIQYSYPILQTAILLVFIIIGQTVLIFAINHNFNKESLVDRIRFNE